jgi:LCP family protein required for cell wall assembly
VQNDSVKKIILIVLIGSLVASVFGFFVALSLSRYSIGQTLLKIMPQHHLTSRINVLIIGLDNTDKTRRADTIMVANINPKTKSIGVISLPRDTRVYIPGIGIEKVNHSYAYGGANLVRKTVSQFLNIPIPYYVEIHMDAVSDIVEKVGGVEIDIDRRMYYVDRAGDLYIDLQPGRQKLNGEKAVQYVRYRADGAGDIGRIARQQNFVRAVANQAMKLTNIFKIPQLIRLTFSHVKTNMPFSTMISLASKMKDAYADGSIDVDTIPGQPMIIDSVSYLIPDQEKTQEMVNRVIHGYMVVTEDVLAKKRNIKVEILNGTGQGDIARRVALMVKNKGYQVSWIGNAAHFNYKETKLVNWKGTAKNKETALFAHELNIKPNHILTHTRPQKPIDFTIVIGSDFLNKRF